MMKRIIKLNILFFLALFFISNRNIAQHVVNNENFHRDTSQLFGLCTLGDSKVFHFVTHEPEFNGNFRKFIIANIDVDSLLQNDTSTIQLDSVRFKFLVTQNGEICQFKFLNYSSEYLKRSVTRIFLLSPKWQPGTYDGGRKLNVYSQLLIYFYTNRKTRNIQTNYLYIKNREL